MSHILRTRFAKDIVAEFLPPSRKTKQVKAIILCDGMPSVPNKRDLLNFFSKKGYWVFFPRYRGSWESDGKFLQTSPHLDIGDIMDQIPRGFKDLFNNRSYKIQPKKLHLIGGSFGGPAIILNSKDKRVAKGIAVSPVVDWQAPSKAEPLGPLFKYVRQGFGNGYRLSQTNWHKLGRSSFYDPIKNLDKVDSSKLLLFHALDDDVVTARPVLKFAKTNNIPIVVLKKGGHLSTSVITLPRFWPRVKKFLNSK